MGKYDLAILVLFLGQSLISLILAWHIDSINKKLKKIIK